MRTRIVIAVMLVAALTLVVMAPGCILEEKTLEVILNSTICNDPPFRQNSADEVFEDVAVIDIQRDLEEAIDANDYTKADSARAELVGASTQVLSLTATHDWKISGRIDVEYLIVNEKDPSDTTSVAREVLLTYTEQSLENAIPAPVPVPLTDAGSALIDRVLNDFVTDQVRAPRRAVLIFRVINGDVMPDPDTNDRIIFTWEACLTINVILPEKADVPDPF